MTIKTITSVGMQWTVINANERETTHAGRHFFAARCGASNPWRIREVDRPISGWTWPFGLGSALTLRHHGGEHETKQLTQAVMEICGSNGSPQ